MSDSWSYLNGSSGDAWERLGGTEGDAWENLYGTTGDAWDRLTTSVGLSPNDITVGIVLQKPTLNGEAQIIPNITVQVVLGNPQFIEDDRISLNDISVVPLSRAPYLGDVRYGFLMPRNDLRHVFWKLFFVGGEQQNG